MKSAFFWPTPHFESKVLAWAQQWAYYSYLKPDINIPYPEGGFRHLLAVGYQCLQSNPIGGFEKLWAFWQESPQWLFGYLSYEMRHDTEKLNTRFEYVYKEPAMAFFRASIVLEWLDSGQVEIRSWSASPAEIWQQILEQTASFKDNAPVLMHARVDKEAYRRAFLGLRSHIFEGDIYEINYCMRYESESVDFEPILFFQKLTRRYPMPFSAVARVAEWSLVSASPERFLKKEGSTLISQPIKGTVRLGKNAAENKLLVNWLKNNEKERAENMMIVDLVRNDLARCSVIGSTYVKELFGVYTFPSINQMISTVASELLPKWRFIDAIKSAFPMGSMTGAPKIRAMELIDGYEEQPRGLYSGALGYITPEGDFDFSVLIRSVFYCSPSAYLYTQVGSALTYDAEVAAEFEECYLKISPILNLLAQK